MGPTCKRLGAEVALRAVATAGLANARDVGFGPGGRERWGEGGELARAGPEREGGRKRGRKKRKERLSFYFKRI